LTEGEPAGKLYALRLLLRLPLRPSAWERLEDIDLPGYLGLTACPDPVADPAGFRFVLTGQLEGFESRPLQDRSAVAANCALLARELNLTDAERDLLHLMVLVQSEEILQQVSGLHGDLNASALARLLAAVLGHPLRQVREALRPYGLLWTCGLLRIDGSMATTLEHKIDLANGLPDLLAQPHDDVFVLFRNLFDRAPAPTLKARDYPHLRQDFGVVRDLLKRMRQGRTQNGPILLWGPPGTGKTEFARTVARAAGFELYEIGTERPESFSRRDYVDRNGAFNLAQALLARQGGAMLLFDEVEDVLPGRIHPLFGQLRDADRGKARMNKTLEGSDVPSIWIANTVSHIDPAALRRFAYVVEMRIPPRQVRKRIIKAAVKGLPVGAPLVDRLADAGDLSPAILAQAAKVARAVAPSPGKCDAVFERAADNALRAAGRRLPPASTGPNWRDYNPAFANADTDLAALAAGIVRTGTGRLCLYGPPGTGKSAYGAWLARQTGRPLLLKRASDLLGPYVGMTEQLIAEAFEEARDEGAVLLLDEADSFLADRRYAQRNWEVTQVNELLSQLEAYEGVCVFTSNLMDNLDPAVLRRFDAKVAFGYLRPEQLWPLFQTLLRNAGIACPRGANATEARRGLDSMANATPGDLTTVARRLRLSETPASWRAPLRALQAELAAKNGGPHRSIGFI